MSTPFHVRSSESGQALPSSRSSCRCSWCCCSGCSDFGKAFNYWNDATHITAEGARYAAVNRKPDPVDAATLQQQLQLQADTAELRDGGTDAIAAPAEVCVDFPNGTSNAGDPVRVTMTFTYHWLPFLGRVDGARYDGQFDGHMRLEAAPTNYAAGCA